MDVHNKSGRSSSSTKSSGCRSSSNDEDMTDMRRGPWMVDEDLTLINHIANHGEGCWNSLARSAGLKRTGKSCRLRWLNYLRPDVRRGNITLEEQLLILEIHSRWGNRWSKIAQHLPGRTDNEIKNYWRTTVQKQAKQLKCDVNSRHFKDTMKYLWMPRLVERIQASAAAGNPSLALVATATSSPEGSTITATAAVYQQQHVATKSYAGTDPENSCITSSSSECSNPFYSAHDVSLPESNPSNDYYPIPSATDQIQGFNFNQGGGNQPGQSDGFPGGQIIGPSGYYQYQHFNHGMEYQAMEHHHHHHHHDKDDQIQQQWMGGDGNQSSDNFWNNIGEKDVNYWYLHNPDSTHEIISFLDCHQNSE